MHKIPKKIKVVHFLMQYEQGVHLYNSDLPRKLISISVMHWKYFMIHFPKDSSSNFGIQSIHVSL